MYFLYIAQCVDGTLYTGTTNDLERRLKQHKNKKGGNYTRSHAVTHFVYMEECKTKSEALKRECEIKKWGRERKLDLINGKI